MNSVWQFRIAFSIAAITSLIVGSLVCAVLLVAIAVLYVWEGRA